MKEIREPRVPPAAIFCSCTGLAVVDDQDIKQQLPFVVELINFKELPRDFSIDGQCGDSEETLKLCKHLYV